jgi:hypothetical protein
MSFILDSKINVNCPECRIRLTVTLRDIQQRRLVRCPRGHSIQLKEQGDGIRKIDRATEDLERSIRRLGGTIRQR